MKSEKIDFPTPLLNALRDGKLVIFAGAGVSMGEPARLPDFKSLAETIAKGTGESLQDGQPIDGFLGRLQDNGVKVHARAKEELSRDDLRPTELHRNLLRLYLDAGPIRVVTTNFDLLFEQAADALNLKPSVEVFRAPALPLGARFNGIVHVHGAVTDYDEMVLTDTDFGRAYINEGWAQRFLVELFNKFTILFVGYSYQDTIMNYLTRALPPSEDDRRFALIPENDADTQRWRALRIQPINYPPSSDHSELNNGIRGLADFFQRTVLDWHSEITEIAEQPPSPDKDDNTLDCIAYALEDETKPQFTQFFTKVASHPEWIDWLDENQYLDALFGDGTLSERDKILSRWLTKQFVRDHATKLFLLIGKHNMRLHPHFWAQLGRQIGMDKETSWDKDVLARWISLLLATVQGYIGTDNRMLVGPGDPLYKIAERCIEHEMLDHLLQIFDTIIGSRIRFREFSLSLDDENRENLLFVDLPRIGVHHSLNELWEKGLKPKLPQVAERLLDRVIKHLEEQYLTLCTWGNAHRKWDPASERRFAIESHERDQYPQEIDVLIDAARDCLEWLASNQADTAARWCNRLVCADAPLLRRLAVHGVSKREDLTADGKMGWLLTNMDQYKWSIRHEVAQLVRQAYPEASLEHRTALIAAVWDYRWPDEENPEREMITAQRQFDWFDLLYKSAPNCALAKEALGKELKTYPEFKSSEPPDRTPRIHSDSVVSHSPWSPEELLAKPAANWLDKLLSFPVTESNHLEYIGLKESVAGATRQNFDWGLDLAKALDRAQKGDVYLWSTLIYAWSTMELGEVRHCEVLSWLDKTELYLKHNSEITSEITKVLYRLVVKEDSVSYALNLLPQANKIATAVWHYLDRSKPIEETDDWIDSALHHPAGHLAEFWLRGFSLWRQQQDPKPTALSDEYRTALSDIVEDQSLPGKLGRTILTRKFAFLLNFDEAWTRENLRPLFDPCSDDFQAAWAGFLAGGPLLNRTVAKAMADPSLKAVKRINSDLSNQRNRFIEYYIHMLSDFAEDPLCIWIPKFFQSASQEDASTTAETANATGGIFSRREEPKDCFASEVGRRLQRMDGAKQQECWQRWLERYWKNRLQGAPAELESGEIEHMLDWLPHLTSVFPKAVDLAVQMPPAPLQNCQVIYELSDSDESELLQNHPESVARLLIYLWKCDLPGYFWPSVQELIDKLLPLDISPELNRELQEIKIQL